MIGETATGETKPLAFVRTRYLVDGYDEARRIVQG